MTDRWQKWRELVHATAAARDREKQRADAAERQVERQRQTIERLRRESASMRRECRRLKRELREQRLRSASTDRVTEDANGEPVNGWVALPWYGYVPGRLRVPL